MVALNFKQNRLPDPLRHAAPQVFDELRQSIISLRLPPGIVLSRVELQTQFGVSSTPIRDALIRLSEDGLVEVYPQRATVVSYIDIELARQAQFLRRSIEQEAVRVLAADPPCELNDQLMEIVARQKKLAKANEVDLFGAADQEFHQAIYKAAGVPDLWSLVRRHSGHIDRIRQLHLSIRGKMGQIIREHAAITAAIAEGKTVEAQQLARDHVSRSIASVDNLRRKFPEYFRNEENP